MAQRVKVTDPGRGIEMLSLVSWKPDRPTSRDTSIVVRETKSRWVLTHGEQARKTDGLIIGDSNYRKISLVSQADVLDNDAIDKANELAGRAVTGNYRDIPGLEDMSRKIERRVRSMGSGYRERRVSRDDADAIRISAGMARERLESLAALIAKALGSDDDE